MPCSSAVLAERAVTLYRRWLQGLEIVQVPLGAVEFLKTNEQLISSCFVPTDTEVVVQQWNFRFLN